MLRNSDVARFVTSLLPIAMKDGYSHRVLLAFNAACLHDFILRSRTLDEGTLAYLLPALLEPLQHVPNIRDATLGSYILLSALSRKCQIAPAALKAVVGAMANCADNVSPTQFTNAVLAVCEQQPQLERFSDGTVKTIIRIP
jgi:U3 small nucleolar RNA-associated protein 10